MNAMTGAPKPEQRPWLAHYPQAVPPQIDADKVGTLADLIRTACTTYADRPAFESFGKTISFAETGRAGQAFADAGIRVLMHPEQFIVLNSDRPEVRENSLRAIGAHARVMDSLGLSRTPWNLLLLHGGKGGRAAELRDLIPDLPDAVRLRLGLENDERAYSPRDLLPVCEAAGTPLVFDAHHHVIHDRLPDQEHPSVREWVLSARRTWTPPDWQVVHLSNGIDGPQDRRHSHLITHLPSAYHDVPWIEVEAKGKEEALAALAAPT